MGSINSKITINISNKYSFVDKFINESKLITIIFIQEYIGANKIRNENNRIIFLQQNKYIIYPKFPKIITIGNPYISKIYPLEYKNLFIVIRTNANIVFTITTPIKLKFMIFAIFSLLTLCTLKIIFLLIQPLSLLIICICEISYACNWSSNYIFYIFIYIMIFYRKIQR